MLSFLYLATEHEGGFGLSFDLFQSNLINLIIVIGILVVYGGKFIGNTLKERRENIELEIGDAEKRARTAQSELDQAQKNLSQAQEEAKKIRAQGEDNAEKAKAAILATAEGEVARIKESANQDVNSEQERAIAELRERVTLLALAKVESQLKDSLKDSDQQQLIDRSIAQLGGHS